MKKLILTGVFTLMFHTLLCAQSATVKELVDRYAAMENVEYIDANKAIIWMVKAKSPKGAMDGVKKLYILSFKAKNASDLYSQFHSEALELFASLGAECVKSENTKDGSMEVYMERKESPTEYMMFMHNTNGDEGFMLMQGEFASSL